MGFIFNVEEAYAKRDALNEQFYDAIANEDVIALDKALKKILENETFLIQGVTNPIDNYTAFITITALREVCKSIEDLFPDAAEEADGLQEHISSTVIVTKMPKEGD